MKKMIYSLLVLATLAITKTNAQVRDNLSLAPIVGFGHSWNSMDYGTGVEKKFNPSFNGGLRLVYSATPHIGFGLDGLYRMEGVKYKSGTTTYTSHANYINLDPKIYYFGGTFGDAFRPKLGVGPNFGFLVGGKTKTEAGSTTTSVVSKHIYNNFNFGLSGLLGFNYRIANKTWLNVDAVYNNGFSDITKSNLDDPQSRSLFLNLGVSFGIGHADVK